jgi:phosphatidylinositol glycan class V
LPITLQYIIGKLTRWDAIYFFKAAHRGYLFEQEWAFGWGFTRVIAIVTAGKGLRLLFRNTF